MPNLPGTGTNATPLPPLPNVGGQNASPATVADVLRWNAQIEFKPMPPDLQAILSVHPEYLAWSANSFVGSFRFTQ